MNANAPLPRSAGTSRWAAFWLALSIFLPAASVYHPNAGWNVNTRLNLIFALVDQGTFRIDDYHNLPPYDTGDKAFFNGHYYSDKVFGLSLLGVVPYLPLKMLGQQHNYHLAHWWIRTFSVSLLSAVLCVLIWCILRGLGVESRQAGILVAAAFYGTLLFPYATVFYPYLPGAMLCLWAWLRVERAAQPDWNLNKNNALSLGILGNGFLTGFLLGAAMLMDYLFGLAVAMLAARALWLWRGRNFLIRTVGAALGGAIPLSAFALYCRAIFGSFSIPYQYEADPLFRIGMSQGFMGITGFQPAAFYYLTVHPYRGLFFASPLLAVALVGAFRMALGRRPAAGEPESVAPLSAAAHGFSVFSASTYRWAGWCALALGFGYLLFNASYYMWWGGWAMGPRLMLPAIAFMIPSLAGVWTWGRAGRAAMCAAAAWSLLMILPPALVDPQTPMWLHTWPELLYPRVSQKLAAEQFLQHVLFWRGHTAPMLGHWLGLKGLWAVLPTLALWAVPAGLFWRCASGRRRKDAPPA
jgi:hypothetical protein